MKKIKIIVIALTLLSFAGSSLMAVEDISYGSSGGQFKKVGAAGGQFLKIGPGGRANGMAGAYGAVANDLTAIYWNPAGVADVKDMAGAFSYTQWFAGFSHSFAALALPLGDNFVAAASLTAFGSDDIPVTTIEFPDGTGNTYRYNDIAVGVTFSGYLTDQFSFGITAKYISSALASLNSSGFAFDIGTMYATGIQGIKLGFSIHNLGTEQEFSGVDLNSTKKFIEQLYSAPIDVKYVASPYSLPLIFRAGLSSDIFESEEHKLVGAVDFVTLSDTPEQFALGAEYTWNNFLSVRAGYRIGSDQLGFGGGIGLKYSGGGFSGQLDYAINPTADLGLINRLSIAVTMGD